LEAQHDPVMTPGEMCQDGNISMDTWRRHYRNHPKLKIMRLSPRRIGARQSNWRAVLEETVERAEATA
jgi:hypothetical protein